VNFAVLALFAVNGLRGFLTAKYAKIRIVSAKKAAKLGIIQMFIVSTANTGNLVTFRSAGVENSS